MTIQRHPQHLPTHLEETYQALVGLSKNGIVSATIRQLVEAVGLQSPLPLLKRLEKLQRLGVIAYQS